MDTKGAFPHGFHLFYVFLDASYIPILKLNNLKNKSKLYEFRELDKSSQGNETLKIVFRVYQISMVTKSNNDYHECSMFF